MKNLEEARRNIEQLIYKERDRQDDIWGRQAGFWDDHDMVKLTVVVEEVGEVAKAILKQDNDNLYEELIQTMAVLMAWAETIEMGQPEADGVIMEEQPSDDETIGNLEKKISKLQTKLGLKVQDKRSGCSHVFSNPRHSNDDNGWDYEYNYYTNYTCEFCGLGLREIQEYSRTGAGSQDIEFENYGKVWLKIKNNKIIVFDPILKTFRRRSEYGNHEIESLIVPGLQMRLEKFAVWDTNERIDNEEKK